MAAYQQDKARRRAPPPYPQVRYNMSNNMSDINLHQLGSGSKCFESEWIWGGTT